MKKKTISAACFHNLLIFTLSIFLLLTSCSDKTPALAKLAPDGVILAFGDSLTYGTGADEDNSYPAILQQLSAHKVINAGVPGELSIQGLTRLEALLDQYMPQLLILCHGGNDLLRKRSKTQLKSNLEKMIQFAHQRGISVVLLGVPEPKIAFMKTAALYEDIAKQNNIPIEASVLLHVLSDKQLKSDTVHPNGRGYALIAEALHKLLVKSGTI